MTTASRLAARLLVGSRLDAIHAHDLDTVHALWGAEAPAFNPAEVERHVNDRREVARMVGTGRRAGDYGRLRAELRDADVLAA
jgi:hypothetical protein